METRSGPSGDELTGFSGLGLGLGSGWGAERGATGDRDGPTCFPGTGRGQETGHGLPAFRGWVPGAKGPGPGQDRFGDGAEVWCARLARPGRLARQAAYL